MTQQFSPVQVDKAGLFMDEESKGRWLQMWVLYPEIQSIAVMFYPVLTSKYLFFISYP